MPGVRSPFLVCICALRIVSGCQENVQGVLNHGNFDQRTLATSNHKTRTLRLSHESRGVLIVGVWVTDITLY